MRMMRPEADLWWRQAQDDLGTAESNLRAERFAASAFFSEQAAEKALKSLIIEKQRELPPHTHDLVKLGQQLKVPIRLMSGLRVLNPNYVNTRYPDAANGLPSDNFDRPIASRHLGIARKVLEWVEKKLKTKR